MANIKITDLPELTTTPNDANLLEIVDKASETPTSKKITWATIKAAVLTAVGKVNEAVGFTLSGGTTSKTLTVEDTSLVNQDLTTDASPTFANITDSGLTASQTVFSDADKKLITKSAADTMIALVGSLTANYKCFVNAAGNGTEWANGMKLVSFTRAFDGASGDVSYTGAGFKPSAAVFFGAVNGAAGHWGFGWAAGAAQGLFQSNYLQTAGAARVLTSDYCFAIQPDVNTGQIASLKTWDSDGMTITWAKGGSPGAGTITIMVLYLR
jgi:hypothetical protein